MLLLSISLKQVALLILVLIFGLMFTTPNITVTVAFVISTAVMLVLPVLRN